MSSSNGPSSQVGDDRYEGISNSSVKGAVWKIARDVSLSRDIFTEGFGPSVVPNSPLDLSQKLAMDTASVQRTSMDISDFLILYRTLVGDGALPAGYDREFMSLEPIVKAAERRENEKAMSITNVGAALWLDKFEKDKGIEQKHSKSIEEQFILACAKEPRRFQSRLQKILYTGPNARSDAEESERQRWILTLGELLRHTSTPMGFSSSKMRRDSNYSDQADGLPHYELVFDQFGSTSSGLRSHKASSSRSGWNIAQVTYKKASEPCTRGGG